MQVGNKIIQMLMDAEIVTDYADEYGEPGYSSDGPVIIGDMWCRAGRYGSKPCDYAEKNPDARYPNGEAKIHSMEYHYPRLFAAMEEQGIEFGWDDEWIVSHESSPSKAYRTQADSYSWQSSILWTDGDFLTPDDDIQDWIDEVVNDPHRALPKHVWSDADLAELGWEEHECGFKNGWYGREDNPEKISEQIRKYEGDVDILFKLSYVAQFDLGFCVFIKKDEAADQTESV